MRITFVLPGSSPVPAGGPKMVFRYANALADKAHEVTVLLPHRADESSPGLDLRRRYQYLRPKFSGAWSPESWMRIHPRVRLVWAEGLRFRAEWRGDAVVATAVVTAERVARWPVEAGRKFYFIQGHEVWDNPVERVQASWRLPLRKIVVSPWLRDLVEAAGARAEELPNPPDHEAFGCDNQVEEREPPTLLWPHHSLPFKGSADVLAALPALRAAAPGLRVRAFGVSARPADWPGFIDYRRNPAQAALRALYNEASVCVAPSHSEGWGLPATEALQCGCAVAASDAGGHRAFLRDGQNALLHRAGDVGALTRNVLLLLGDRGLRGRLAHQGMRDMRARRMEDSAARLETILKENPTHG